MLYDVVVLGGGPSGISAGIYVKRTGSSVLVLDNNKAALSAAKKIDNYYGIESISGDELKQRGVAQYQKLGGEYIQTEVLKISFKGDNYKVHTTHGDFLAKSVILALGAGKKKTIEALEKYENANVSYCAVCDGFFYSGKSVAVIGSEDFALSEAEELSKNAKNVYVVAENCKKSVNLSENIQIINKKIKSFGGDLLVEEIIFDDNSKLKIDGIFVALGSLSSFEICKQLGILTDQNRIIVDKHFMTNVAGIFACGDCIGGLLQVCKAVSDGAQAGLEAVRYIKMKEE